MRFRILKGEACPAVEREKGLSYGTLIGKGAPRGLGESLHPSLKPAGSLVGKGKGGEEKANRGVP